MKDLISYNDVNHQISIIEVILIWNCREAADHQPEKLLEELLLELLQKRFLICIWELRWVMCHFVFTGF